MKLLLVAHLPLLPLEALRPSWSEPGPFVVIDEGRVLTMSQEAAQAGVRPGMRTGGVTAVAPLTIILERSLEKEEQALSAIATALMQYTPDLTLTRGFSVTMEVGASLTLFRGSHALCLRVAQTLRALGFTAKLGLAPTAEGAWLFSRSYRRRGRVNRRRALTASSMTRMLNALPCGLIPEAVRYHDWLNDIGAKQIGALRQLPRAGLLRRTSKDLLITLDRAYGDEPEMLEWLKPPLAFSARVETWDRIEHADALLDGATSLLLQLVGWLTSAQKAICTLTFYLEHERGRAAVAPTELEISLAEPVWHEAHLIRLLKERLGKLELSRPVIALRLEAVKIEAMPALNDSLFPEPGGSPQDYARLIELLIARNGQENVLMPADVEDYRPEVCNAWMSAVEKRPKVPSIVLHGRPIWLLEKPIRLLMKDERPFYGSPLKIISEPERLEAGWWDDKIAARDYYVAQGDDASCYWVYLELVREDPRWYLHGLFG